MGDRQAAIRDFCAALQLERQRDETPDRPLIYVSVAEGLVQLDAERHGGTAAALQDGLGPGQIVGGQIIMRHARQPNARRGRLLGFQEHPSTLVAQRCQVTHFHKPHRIGAGARPRPACCQA